MADTDQVLNLAAIIREVDGNNRKGAAALAESILDHPRFRAALADGPAVPDGREPVSVTGQPSDEELLGLLPQGNESGFWLPKGLPSDWVDGEFIAPPKAIIAFARAVLARWGNPAPQPPAEGEVAQLVQHLHHAAEVDDWDGASPEWCQSMLRAADLLQHLSPPQPVPVSERPWESEGWCAEDGRCWVWNRGSCEWWELVDSKLISHSSIDYTHCLPAHALPLPEVK